MSCSSQTFPHYLFTEDLKPLVYTELFLSLVILIAGFLYIYNSYFKGYPLKTFIKIDLGSISRFLRYAILQRRVLRESLPGIMHGGIFYGFLILFIATLVRALDFYYSEYVGEHILFGYPYYVGKLLFDLGGLIAVAGVIIALYRRFTGITRNLPNTSEDIAILLVLLVILTTGFILDGIAYKVCRSSLSPVFNPMGFVFSLIFSGLDSWTVELIYRGVWIFHLTISLITISILPFTKLSHIVFSALNIYYSREKPAPEATFKPVENIDKIIEEKGYVGMRKLEEASWLQRLNYLACTECARCHNSCPAAESGKVLSPMRIMMNMRKGMEEGKWDSEVVPMMIDSEAIWSCVTCGACITSCPVLINQVETIADVRRGLFSTGQDTPNELLSVSYNVMRSGNPYGYNPVDREEWISQLASKGLVEIAEEGVEYDMLYWIGCNTSYDQALRMVAENLLEILRSSGLRIGVLKDEICCGEPVRRIGDELTFREIAKSNYEKLSRYRFKKLLLSCPHGFTVFKRDYPSIGFKINAEVVHHSQVLAELIEKQVIKPGALEGVKVTYHDPCYLGRWNEVYDQPRSVIKSIRGLELVEMPRSRERSFCCGGGGGHLFFEVKRGVRISRLRAEEAHKTGAKVLVTACPMCNMMLRAESQEYDLKVVDLVLLLKDSMRKQ
ncbi:MAG: (Fe-S)-binding protein [Sulfolobales archaeon]